MGKVTEQVRFFEDGFEALAEMYRKEMEGELVNPNGSIGLRELTGYDWAPSLENNFYSMVMPKTGREIGLILPIRRLIFHSLDARTSGNVIDAIIIDALSDFSKRRGYELKYDEYAWQHEPIIEKLAELDRMKSV